MSQNTSQILARALAQAGVTHAFGMPGGEVLPLLDALAEEGVDFVLVRHEGSAGFMADAAWQLTGAPGVCVATLGPGATNLISGVAGALLDRAPVVAITGQVSEGLKNVYTHQTLDQLALFRPVVRHQVTLTASEAWREIPLALRRLWEGRPAPVHLNLPADVARAPARGAFVDRFEPAPRSPDPAALDAAAATLARARRPVLLIGPADRSAAAAVAARRLCRAMRGPALCTYRAKGLIDEQDPSFAGAFGLSPVVDAHQTALLAGADALVLFGFDAAELRPHWLPGWPGGLPAIVLDAHPPTDLLHPAEHLLIGSLPPLAHALAARLEAQPCAAAWEQAALDAHRAAIDAPFDDGPTGPATAIRAVQRALPADAIVALDVGAHRITASHVWRSAAPGLLLQSNGLASMGFGVPAAITAALVRPRQTAVALTGDMGLWMALGELGLAAERGLNLIVVYLADSSLSLIELKQARLGLAPVGVRFQNPEVGALAQAFGGVGVAVRGPDEISAAVRAAVQRGGLSLIEATIDPAHYNQQM